MEAAPGILTAVLTHFLDVFTLGREGVSQNAVSLLSIIAAIELVLCGLGWAFTGQDALYGLIKKVLLISFFVFLVERYDQLIHVVADGFIHTGRTAATGSTIDLNTFRNPSKISDLGFVVSAPLFDHIRALSFSYNSLPLGDAFLTGLGGLAIILSFFVIAIQVFVTYLEFSLITTLGLIFIPFGVFQHTAFLAERVFAAIIAFGVKLMVLGLIVSVATPVLATVQLPPDPSWRQLFEVLVVCLAVAALSWHAPGIAAGLLAGSPTLSVGTAVNTAVPAAAAAAGTAIGVAGGAYATAKGASFGLGRLNANTQTAASQGLQNTDSAGNSSGSRSSSLRRGASAIARGAGATATQGASSAAAFASEPFVSSFRAGRDSAPQSGFQSEQRSFIRRGSLQSQTNYRETDQAAQLHSGKVVPIGRQVQSNSTPEDSKQSSKPAESQNTTNPKEPVA